MSSNLQIDTSIVKAHENSTPKVATGHRSEQMVGALPQSQQVPDTKDERSVRNSDDQSGGLKILQPCTPPKSSRPTRNSSLTIQVDEPGPLCDIASPESPHQVLQTAPPSQPSTSKHAVGSSSNISMASGPKSNSSSSALLAQEDDLVPRMRSERSPLKKFEQKPESGREISFLADASNSPRDASASTAPPGGTSGGLGMTLSPSSRSTVTDSSPAECPSPGILTEEGISPREEDRGQSPRGESSNNNGQKVETPPPPTAPNRQELQVLELNLAGNGISPPHISDVGGGVGAVPPPRLEHILNISADVFGEDSESVSSGMDDGSRTPQCFSGFETSSDASPIIHVIAKTPNAASRGSRNSMSASKSPQVLTVGALNLVQQQQRVLHQLSLSPSSLNSLQLIGPSAGGAGRRAEDRKMSAMTPTPRDWPSEIIPNFLYLGGQRAALSQKQMDARNITRYLCCAFDAPLPNHVDPERISSGDVVIKHLKMRDGAKTQLKEHFTEAFQFIRAAKKENKKILIYCREGKSRSASIVIAYFIRYYKLSYESAFSTIRQRRSAIDPNFAFCSQLDQYEQCYIEDCNGTPTSVWLCPTPVHAGGPLMTDHRSSLASTMGSFYMPATPQAGGVGGSSAGQLVRCTSNNSLVRCTSANSLALASQEGWTSGNDQALGSAQDPPLFLLKEVVGPGEGGGGGGNESFSPEHNPPAIFSYFPANGGRSPMNGTTQGGGMTSIEVVSVRNNSAAGRLSLPQQLRNLMANAPGTVHSPAHSGAVSRQHSSAIQSVSSAPMTPPSESITGHSQSALALGWRPPPAISAKPVLSPTASKSPHSFVAGLDPSTGSQSRSTSLTSHTHISIPDGELETGEGGSNHNSSTNDTIDAGGIHDGIGTEEAEITEFEPETFLSPKSTLALANEILVPEDDESDGEEEAE